MDPTAIEMELDPLHARMRGVTAHGNIPFDVPYVTPLRAMSNLWVGGCADGLILPHQVDHIVSLYPWEKYTVEHRIKSALSVVMYDKLTQAMDQVDSIAMWVEACVQDGPTLVHCQAGLNRSMLIAATVLMRRGWGAGHAIAYLRQARSPAVLCNESFERWLRDRIS